MKILQFSVVLFSITFLTNCKQSDAKIDSSKEIAISESIQDVNCSCSFLSKKCGLKGCTYRYKCNKTGLIWTRVLSNNNSQAKQLCELDCCDAYQEGLTKIVDISSSNLKAKLENITVISSDENDVLEEIKLTPQIALEPSEQCAGQWVDYYTYKNGRLYVLNIGSASSCISAYRKFKRCLGYMDNDRVYCGRIIACAPYSICK